MVEHWARFSGGCTPEAFALGSSLAVADRGVLYVANGANVDAYDLPGTAAALRAAGAEDSRITPRRLGSFDVRKLVHGSGARGAATDPLIVVAGISSCGGASHCRARVRAPAR